MMPGTARKRRTGQPGDGSRQGFTLLELLVTITILSAMAAMMFGAFRMSARFWERGDRAIESSQRFRIMTQLFRKQVGCAYALDVRNQQLIPGGMNDPNDSALQQALQSMQTGAALNTPVFLGGPGEMRFLSVYPLRPLQNAGLNVIYYFTRPMADGEGYELVEAERLYLNRAMLLKMDRIVPQGQQVVVFDKLQEVKFEYLEVDALNNKTTWMNEWSSERQQSLPAAIALDLVFLEDVGKMGKKHRLIVPIFSQPFRGRGSIGNPNLFRN